MRRASSRSSQSAACCPNPSASSRVKGGMPPRQGVQVFSAKVSVMGYLHHRKRDTGGCFVSDYRRSSSQYSRPWRHVPAHRSPHWLDDVESVAIEEERMIAEQIFELWNHGIVIGNGPRFELSQSSLELCGVKFHLYAPFGSPRRCAPRHRGLRGSPTSRWSNAKLGHSARPS